MTRFRFLHAADLHLDTPFEGLGRLAPRVAARLRNASLDAFDDLVQVALDYDAAFVVIAGDLYDGAQRGIRAQLRFARGVRRLAERGVQVFVVHGNHDPLDEGWQAIRDLPPNLTIFGAERVTTTSVERNGRTLAHVYGISYARRDVVENLSLRFRRMEAPGLHIGLLHCNVGLQEGHASYSPCSEEDLRRAGLDYWALGHIHRRQVIANGHPWIVYPGNLQGRSTKASEAGPKGAILVEAVVDADGSARVENLDFVPLDRARFVRLDLGIAAVADLPALEALILQDAARLQAEHAGRDLLVRVMLDGRGPVHRDLQRPGARHALLDSLREQADQLPGLVWFDQIETATRGALDREPILRRGDFSSELIRTAELLASDPEQFHALLEERALVLRKVRLQHWLPELDTWDWDGLLREAEEKALDLLEEERER